MQLQFAGDGDFEARSMTGGQTADNTVVIGQKVHAKVETSDKVSVDTDSIVWSYPSGGYCINDYITPDDPENIFGSHEIYVEELYDYYDCNNTQDMFMNEDIEFYYITNALNKLGSIVAQFELEDINGKIYHKSASASYYVEAPVTTLTSTQTSATLRDTDDDGIYNEMILCDENNQQDGMTFFGSLEAPAINGAGEVNFLQTVITQTDRTGSGLPDQEITSDGEITLDTSFPYGDTGQDTPESNVTCS